MAARPAFRQICVFMLLAAAAVLSSGCSKSTVDPGAKNDLHRLERSLKQVADQPVNDLRTKPVKSAKPQAKNAASSSLLMKKPPRAIRGIYVTSYVANGSRMKELIELVDRTELNAMVLDINSGTGLTAPLRQGGPDGPVRPVPSERKAAKRYRDVIRELKRKKIYLIARIVTFNNPELAKAAPAWTLKRRDGSIWSDKNGTRWIDPYKQESWEYAISLAEYAAGLGFDEIQFDYVRFPENGAKVDREVKYADTHGRSKAQVIAAFLNQARTRLHQAGVPISADVFGMVGSSQDDMGIGQSWQAIAPAADVISPMLYPSHYSEGIWGIAHPDLSPGTIVKHALKDAATRNAKLRSQGAAAAQIRPWLQSFTASWIHPHQKYGQAQIREQILAARQAGIHSYMLWNSSCRYPEFKT
ncbi:putative glycoside hydrolase [Cohnella hongkongensis]|uniref:Glycoside hydrolase n=1 Tax=Cohnella hongkongensis TaxID=178337 RepID=A0ABV9FP71_9BACL